MNPSNISALVFEQDGAEVGWGWAVPALEPFDDRNAIDRVEVRFQAGAEDVPGVAEAVEVEMVEGQATVAVFLDEGEGGGLDATGDAEAEGDPLHELGFAGAEIAGQGENPARGGGESEAFPEFDRFLRAMRNERIHEWAWAWDPGGF